MLDAQGNACAMCDEAFGDDQFIYIDHDHACCPGDARHADQVLR